MPAGPTWVSGSATRATKRSTAASGICPTTSDARLPRPAHRRRARGAGRRLRLPRVRSLSARAPHRSLPALLPGGLVPGAARHLLLGDPEPLPGAGPAAVSRAARPPAAAAAQPPHAPRRAGAAGQLPRRAVLRIAVAVLLVQLLSAGGAGRRQHRPRAGCPGRYRPGRGNRGDLHRRSRRGTRPASARRQGRALRGSGQSAPGFRVSRADPAGCGRSPAPGVGHRRDGYRLRSGGHPAAQDHAAAACARCWRAGR